MKKFVNTVRENKSKYIIYKKNKITIKKILNTNID